MTRFSRSIVVGLMLAAAGVASAADIKTEDAIRARQSIMRVIGMNFGPLANMAQGKAAFNKEAFVTSATRMESVWAMNPGQFFVPGSDKPVSGAKIANFTDAKSEVWSKDGDFKGAYDKAGKEITKLAQAARSGDEAAMKTAAGDVGKACKSCHDDFRVK